MKNCMDASVGLTFSLQLFQRYRRSGILQAKIRHISAIQGTCMAYVHLTAGSVTACYLEDKQGQHLSFPLETLCQIDRERGPFKGIAILLKGPLQPADIQLYDLYALIILLIASLLPPRTLFLFAVVHSAFIIVELYIHPDTPALAQNLQPQAQLFPAIVRSVGLQLLGSTVAYIWVRSATQANERANRAEMVATLEHTIAQERASSEREKQVLEESIQQLIQAQMAATRGQVTNQLPYPPAKVLWPLVGAMNLLWTRFQRTQQIEREHQRLQQVISSYIRAVQKDSHASLPLVQTGTILNQLILAAQTSRGHETQQGIFHSDRFRQTEFPPRE